MKTLRILKTSVIKLVLKYAIFITILITLGLSFLYWSTSQYTDAQLESGLKFELSKLKEVDATQGREKLISILSSNWQEGLDTRHYYLLVNDKGEKILGDLLAWPKKLDPNEEVVNIWIENDIAPIHLEENDGYWPMIAGKLADGSMLLITLSVLPAEDIQEFTLFIIAIILITSIIFTMMMGWVLGQTILKRIDNINNTAKAIETGELDQRIVLSSNNDEFDELGQHLNSMLDMIEKLLSGMREVTDNIAHDLRSPLTRVLNHLDVALLESRSEKEYKQVIQDAVIQIQSLITTFNSLLEITQTEAGSYGGEWLTINISCICTDIGELYAAVAEEKNKYINLDIAPNLTIIGNQHLLSLAISNLLENAIKYTSNNGKIELKVRTYQDSTAIVISDDGPGIPEEFHDKVFERFVRLDNSRTTEGNGLGLSLVKAVVELHGAKVYLNDNQPGLKVKIVFDD